MTPSAVLIAALPLALGQATPQDVHEDVRKILADDAFQFCHDEDLSLFTMEREYCELVEDKNDVCPALPKVCKNKFQGDLSKLPLGRERFGRDGVDYGPRRTASGKGRQGYGGTGNGSGDGNGSGSGSGDGSTSGSGNGNASNGNGSNGNGATGNGSNGNGSNGSGSNGNGSNGSGSNGSGSNGSGKGDSAQNGSGSGKGSGHDNKGSDDKSQPKDSEAPKESAKPPEPPPDPPEPIKVPGWVSMIFRVLFYVLAAALIAGIVYYIVKNLMKDKEVDPDEEEPTSKRGPEEEEEARPRGPVETDVDRLLARARAAAAAGDYKKAIEDAYAALLRRLEGDGIIDLHPSRTNGDYVRALRERAELKSAVRGIATDVERVQFGSEAPSPTSFESIYRRVLPLVGRAAAVLLLIFAFGPLASCDGELVPRDRSVLHAPFSKEKPRGGSYASGLQGVVQVLQKADLEVTFDRPENNEPTGSAKAIVLMPGTDVDKATWKRLRSWVKKDGGTLVLAGWRPEILEDFKIRSVASRGAGVVRLTPFYDHWAPRHELALPYAGALEGEDTSHAQSAKNPNNEVLLTRGDETYAFLIDGHEATGAGKIVVFADDRLFANIAMALGDNASFLRSFFSRALLVKGVEIWDDPHGGGGGAGGGADGEGGKGADSPLESIAKAHLLPIVLQLLALVILYLIFRGTRFGSPRDPKEETRRSFADHGRALGMTYARAGASRHAASVYSVWALDRLRERLLGSGRRGGLSQLAEAIAARTGREFNGVMQVLVEAYGMRDEVAPPSSFRSADVEAARARGGPPSPKTEQARHFWIMEQLDGYLAATTGSAKTAGKGR